MPLLQACDAVVRVDLANAMSGIALVLSLVVAILFFTICVRKK